MMLCAVKQMIGIPSNEPDTIYFPFRRASNVKFRGGFGVGFSLVNKITELHGAKLNVYSTINEGTRVEMVFKKLM